MEIKITKRTLLCEQNNCMTHNWTYLVQGRIINDDNTKYKKFKLVINFDAFDYQEYRREYTVGNFTVIDYLNELISYYCDHINSYDDCKEFYELCNESIERYNEGI